MNESDSVWPEQVVPDATKKLILKFFSIVDIRSENSGKQLADEIFSLTGTMRNGAKNFKGSNEIQNSRRGAWDAWTSRKHSVLKVYVCNEKADDILLLGRLDATFLNGNAATGEFCARIKVVGTQENDPRFSSYEVWADAEPFVAAMKGD